MNISAFAIPGLCLAAAPAAFAGQCPADQVLTKPRVIEGAPDVGVTRPILHSRHDRLARNGQFPPLLSLGLDRAVCLCCACFGAGGGILTPI